MLPDREQLLGAINQCRARSKGDIAMSRRHDGDQGCVTYGEIAHPVGDSQGDEVELSRNRLGDLLKYLASRRVALIGEPLDILAVVVIADIAREGDHGTGAVITHGSLHRLKVEGSVDHFDKTDCTHAAIIGVLGRVGLGKCHSTTLPRGAPVRDVHAELSAIIKADGAAAMATVVRTWKSAPRPAGATMLVTEAGEAVGSVSGGCVEGALYELGQEVLADGQSRLETYGVSDDDAFAVGLTCGGILEIFVEKVSRETWPELEGVLASIRAEEPVAVATIVRGPHFVGRHLVIRPDRREGSLGTDRLDDTIYDDALGMLAAGTTGFLHYGPEGERLGDGLDVFVSAYAPPAQMFIFGAIDFSAALVRVGKLLDYRVTICDARPVFATAKRFPEADEVVVDWPHRWLESQTVDARTVIAVLTHDPKFDVPALTLALRTPAGYVGAMGSRRTHEDRLVRLRENGVTEEELARLHSPIGLDLGARTPEETAISIAAEIIESRWGGSGRNLSRTDGPIHPGAPR